MGNTQSIDIDLIEVPKLEDFLKNDPYLKPYETEIKRRYGCFAQLLNKINEHENGLLNFTDSYKTYGLHVNLDNSVTAIEWAPRAKNIFLLGEFSVLNFLPIYFKFPLFLDHILYLLTKNTIAL